MSSTSGSGSNADSQNDSDVNFIPGYAVDIEDEVNLSSSEDESSESIVKPYEDEPIADENWIANYNEQMRVEEDHLRWLQIRLEGLDKVNDW